VERSHVRYVGSYKTCASGHNFRKEKEYSRVAQNKVTGISEAGFNLTIADVFHFHRTGIKSTVKSLRFMSYIKKRLVNFDRNFQSLQVCH
jgi:hypothetical protein